MKIARRTGAAVAVVMTLGFVVDRLGRLDGNFPLPATAAAMQLSQSSQTTGSILNSADALSSGNLLPKAVGVVFVGICLVGMYRVSLMRRKMDDGMQAIAARPEADSSPTVMTQIVKRGDLTLASWQPGPIPFGLVVGSLQPLSLIGSEGVTLSDLSSPIRQDNVEPLYLSQSGS